MENDTIYGRKSTARVITSVSITPEFYNLIKENRLNMSEALRIGVSIMLGDLGIKEYDNKLNLFRKMVLYREELEKSKKQLNQFIEKTIEQTRPETTQKGAV